MEVQKDHGEKAAAGVQAGAGKPLGKVDGTDCERPVWRFIRSGYGTPAYNMAVDEAIMTAHGEGRVPPTIRFYGWRPAGLSIGYFQKALDEVDLEETARQGIGFVRRPTGGRAVLHDRELTYSIIVSEHYPGIPAGVTDAYRVLSEGLLQGFLKLGLQAEMVNLATEEEKEKYASMSSAACFDSPSWYELVVEGRKVAGSAQMRREGVVLQHGSILMDLDADQLFSLLRFRSEELMRRLKATFRSKAVAINELRREHGLAPVELREVEEAFRHGFAVGMGVELQEAELSPFERELAGQLTAEKYGSDEWNLRR